MNNFSISTLLAVCAVAHVSCKEISSESLDNRSRSGLSSANVSGIPTQEFLFKIGGSIDSEESFTIENTLKEQTITLVSDLMNQELMFDQTDREKINQTFQTSENRSQNLTLNNQREVTLSSRPVNGTLVITVGNQQTSDFSIDGRQITFGNSLSNGDQVKADYITVFRDYTLNELPASGTLIAKIGNTALDADLFTIENLTFRLAAAPAANQTLTIDYRKDEPLVTNQNIGSNVLRESIQVAYNDLPVDSDRYSFNQDNGIISFTPPPADASKVKVSYTINLGDQLSYDLSSQPTNPSMVDVIDAEDNTPLSFSLSAQTIRILQSDFARDRKIKVVYKDQMDITQGLKLAQIPNEGSLNYNFDVSNCLSGNGLTIQERNIAVDCELAEPMTIKFFYSFTQNRSRFPITAVTEPNKGTWEVYYNGAKSHDWRREGNTIFVPEGLDSSTDVLIRFFDITKSGRK